MNTRSEQSDLY
jgi:hypothetical protein